MKINYVGSNTVNNNQINNKNNNSGNPNFKGLMDFPGIVMQGLENSGFIGSFLVQDTLGMTLPRTRQGLYRDVTDDKKKDLRNLNYKEGAEVFIRESLSGPLLMFSPVAVLLLGRKFVGKSTFTNSSMIKRLGKNLTETIKGTSHESTKALKKDFYKRNVTAMVQNTTNAADKTAETAFIDNVVEKIEKLDRYDAKIATSKGARKKAFKQAKKLHQNKLVDMFNDFHKTHSSEYSMVNKVKLDRDAVFATDKTIDGMRGYAADALKNKNAADITEDYTAKLQKNSLIKRGVVNALAAISTVASVSIVPLLYKIINPVPPGALAGDNNNAQNAANKQNSQNTQKSAQNKKQDKNGQVAFTGKLDSFAKHFEFNGTQLTPALMTTLAGVGLIGPRVHTAVKRAPEDPNTKKKDYSEIPEILTRDVISTGAVTFGVPMLSKAIISSYEDASGFVLQNRPDKKLTTAQKILDKLNPFSGYSPYGLKDLNQIYGNINTTEKLGEFSHFVNNNNGSLAKIFNTLDSGKEVFSEFGLDIKELSKQKDRKAANNTIMAKMTENKDFADKLINVMKPANEGKANNILKRARALNSYTSFVATLFLVPAFLGFVLPEVVYGLTAKRHKKLHETNNSQNIMNNAAAAQTNNNGNIDYSTLKHGNSSQTFGHFKHS
ncbi:MAG: hypothetical protein LUB59_06165 [Candidatus Gastranaerophilales bacterium]|nr:hypothetical protein [Candidatus Gastranaerophilales bacterium]